MKEITVTPLAVQTASDLMAEDLPPIRMVVGDVLPAGLILLAGDPKAGKSLVCQCLALSISTGSPAWGALHVDIGDVLYLALEGGKHSFRQRLAKMLGGAPAPDRLDIAYSSAQLGGKLERQLETWLHAADEPRLIVVDTYTAVAPEIRGVNRHREEYHTLAGLADLSTRWPDCLFIVVHHTRKSDGSDDVMQRISGSQGMTAVTDGNAVLARQVAARQCVLSVRPRNAEESEIVLERDPDTLRWQVVGSDERRQLSGPRQQVLAWLDANPDGGPPKVIASSIGLDHDGVRQLLVQMHSGRQVHKPRRGWYQALGKDPDASVE